MFKMSDFSRDVQRRARMQVRTATNSGLCRQSAPLARAGKYGNHKTGAGGRTFDSKKEARRYGDLLMLARVGKIKDLELQVEFPLIVNDVLVCTYVADFSYMQDGKRVVEDVKSAATRKNRAYRIKAKLLRALTGIDIEEI